jgi:hypothetical protein
LLASTVTGFASIYALGVTLSGGFGRLIQRVPAFYVVAIGALSLVGGVMPKGQISNHE